MYLKKNYFRGGREENVLILGVSRLFPDILEGVDSLCRKFRGGQDFAADGREIEGPPPS